MYKKARDIDPSHANSIYNHAVLLDGSLKQKQVSLGEELPPQNSFAPRKFLCHIQQHHKGDCLAVGEVISTDRVGW